MRKFTATVLAAATAALVGCAEASSVEREGPDQLPQRSVPIERNRPADIAPTPRDISLARLPARGFAVSKGHHTWFVSLDGRVIQQIDGFEVAGNVGNKGVWLQGRRIYLRVDAVRDRLVVFPRAAAERRVYQEGRAPDLPPPGASRGTGLGSWRFSLPRPDGTLLAQWSGECEVPTAFWVAPGAGPIIATGESSFERAPESEALGWGPHGRAYVHIRDGACGGGGNPPGVYAFTAPGAGTLVYETPSYAGVDMWRVGES